MKHFKSLIFCFLLFLSIAYGDLLANIFAAHVQLDFDGTFPATIRYRLIENATSVTVFIKKGDVIVRTLSGVGDQLNAGH